MKNYFSKTVLALGLAIGATSSWADVITINHLASLPAVEDFVGYRAIFSPDMLFNESLLIHQGDTIDLTINFLPGQSVHMVGAGRTQVFGVSLMQDSSRSPVGTSNFTLTDRSFNLIGAQGDFPASLQLPNLSGGHASIFSTVPGQFLGAGQGVTFTGLHTRFTVGALQNGQSYYYGTNFYMAADQLSVNLPAVPEPATWGMLLGGLGLLAWMRRRKLANIAS